MSRPVDVPRCTPASAHHAAPISLAVYPPNDHRHRRSTPPVYREALVRRLPWHALRIAFVAISIPITVLAGGVLAPRQAAETIRPAAATQALLSAAPLRGDAPLAADAAVAARMSDAAFKPGSLALGNEIASHVVVGSVLEDRVNLRSGPGTGNRVLGRLARGTQLEVLGQQGGWYRVATARGTVGWVSAEYFRAGSTAARPAAQPAARGMSVAGARVNLRSGPGTGFRSYGTMVRGVALQPLARSGAWVKVRSPRGTVGWVHRDLVAAGAGAIAALPAEQVSAAPRQTAVPSSAVAAPASAGAAALARRFVGARYVWGGASPSGFDCSGLALYVYRQLGVSLPHKAALQYNVPGQRIGSVDALAPGDLVFFVRTTPARGITHVGIYTDNGRMVTAGTPRTGVQEVSLSSPYWRSRFAGGVRPAR